MDEKHRNTVENVPLEIEMNTEEELTENDISALPGEKEEANGGVEHCKQTTWFPLLKLPKVVLLEIARNLEQTHRRSLMQTCSLLRVLLFRRKAKDLDCRIPAYISAGIEKTRECDHLLSIYVSAPEGGVVWTREWSLPREAIQMPQDLRDQVQELEENFDSENFRVSLFNIPAQGENHPGMCSFFEMVTKHFPTVVEEHFFSLEPSFWRQRVSFVLDCSCNLSLSMIGLSRRSASKNPWFRQQIPIEQIISDEAAKRGIPLRVDLTGPDTEYILRQEISDDGAKSATLWG